MRDNPGMTKDEARVAVDRDNLALSIQSGLIREDAREIVAKMTDAQVTALCPNGNPPAFEPEKRIPGGTRAEPKYEPEKWNHGSYGGVVHVARDATAEKIETVAKVSETEIAKDRIARFMRGEKGNDYRGADFGGATKDTLEEVENPCGSVPKVNALGIYTKDLHHLKKHFGANEHFRRQVGTTIDDLAMLPDILNNHDRARLGEGGWRNGKRYPTVVFTRITPTATVDAVYIVGDKFYPKSMWKKKS